MKKCQVEMMNEKLSWMQEAAGGKHDLRYALRKFRKDCENFATIAKISQSLRNFCYAHFFAKLAKFLYHSEISLSY